MTSSTLYIETSILSYCKLIKVAKLTEYFKDYESFLFKSKQSIGKHWLKSDSFNKSNS